MAVSGRHSRYTALLEWEVRILSCMDAHIIANNRAVSTRDSELDRETSRATFDHTRNTLVTFLYAGPFPAKSWAKRPCSGVRTVESNRPTSFTSLNASAYSALSSWGNGVGRNWNAVSRPKGVTVYMSENWYGPEAVGTQMPGSVEARNAGGCGLAPA